MRIKMKKNISKFLSVGGYQARMQYTGLQEAEKTRKLQVTKAVNEAVAIKMSDSSALRSGITIVNEASKRSTCLKHPYTFVLSLEETSFAWGPGYIGLNDVSW